MATVAAGIDVRGKTPDIHPTVGRHRHQRYGRPAQGRPPPGDGGAERVVMEATGRMHRALLQSPQNRGFAVVVASPRRCRDLPGPGGAPGRTGRAGARVPAAPSAGRRDG